jgi:hypothetical protein
MYYVTLRSGCRLVVAPLFHLPVDWGERLHLGFGVERAGGGLLHRSSWRPPDAGELALLLPDESQPLPRENLTDCLCLFRLPRHLHATWWRLVAQLNEAGTMLPGGFDAFALEVGRFLAFKEIPLPEGASLDLLVRQPGHCTLPEKADVSQLWGGINLGDEATSVIFINLPAHDLLTEMERCSAEFIHAVALDELVDQFQTLYPDYPTVRLRIEPGEGYRLPAHGLLVDACTLDKREPDVLLRIRRTS